VRSLPANRPRFANLIAAGLAAVTLGAPGLAGAHEYWLSLKSGVAQAREPVELGALAGTGFRGEKKPYSPLLCVRLLARAARTLDLARAAGIGDFVWARFAPTDAGGAMFGYQSDFSPIELPGSQFDAYLALEGLDGPLLARRSNHVTGPGRERYRRCAKGWLEGADAARATEPFGFPLEIVPLDRPGAASPLRVRIVLDGRPLADALVRVWRSPLDANGQPLDATQRDSVGACWQGRSDTRGEVTVPISEPGEWLVSVVHMQACPDPAVADWESTWASLFFSRGREPRSR
jgi:hypothetical protein